METTEEVASLAVAVRGHGGQWGPVQGTAEGGRGKKKSKWHFEEKSGKLARPVCH